MLRHTYASQLVMRGVPLYTVSKLLDHSTIQVTEIYAHLTPDHLADAVKNLNFWRKDGGVVSPYIGREGFEL